MFNWKIVSRMFTYLMSNLCNDRLILKSHITIFGDQLCEKVVTNTSIIAKTENLSTKDDRVYKLLNKMNPNKVIKQYKMLNLYLWSIF